MHACMYACLVCCVRLACRPLCERSARKEAPLKSTHWPGWICRHARGGARQQAGSGRRAAASRLITLTVSGEHSGAPGNMMLFSRMHHVRRCVAAVELRNDRSAAASRSGAYIPGSQTSTPCKMQTSKPVAPTCPASQAFSRPLRPWKKSTVGAMAGMICRAAAGVGTNQRRAGQCVCVRVCEREGRLAGVLAGQTG